jgi:transcription termination/antitermination protein NusG
MEGRESNDVERPQTSNHPSWYAVYTQNRHEAKVEQALQRKGLEVFLPRITIASRRRDRRLFLQRPLFPGYIFVRTLLTSPEYHEILRAPGVVHLLGLGGPVPVPETTVDSVKAIVDSPQPFYPWPYLQPGNLVQVREGPLAGVVGTVIARKDKQRRLVVSVDLFQRAVAVELDNEAVARWS